MSRQFPRDDKDLEVLVDLLFPHGSLLSRGGRGELRLLSHRATFALRSFLLVPVTTAEDDKLFARRFGFR